MLIELSVNKLRSIQQAFAIVKIVKTLCRSDDYHRLETRINEAVGEPGYMAKREMIVEGIRETYVRNKAECSKALEYLAKDMPLPPAYL